ncbi:UDP-N-acetylglucosamine--N-acetylmuramyl-(pentapeptide) pyrophosphoryl-undecaprenol N-acetylglucosamine transferase [Microcella frigidaquae]|uniref:UDP-N-acetylglucosamine--N-acetylmuramyl-(pentapeptide) pyrophosphoryl-undecaprenol N-acetylglucosamine transferase n=1 Tax=Microcella frigidaquae TaxID=424758 RepID=A0A840XLR3_9MICO|nr:UDP-N-acetylglucosamine--N-acetylmuramyl-(pentapeptide) pyrophosphoryl-undecaprenol N-acetylglucosamine transferase [Microcella frigidaquae]MBB5616839.1 UDP-N-acetylglucosamine--N-acetylmuramyl-(pentapeptide) pyrophosphoryl-undecaprenol N-acetylglucosamine transferase [Microcella frigidaquae]NHN43722.1 UDP-N-acetylglucosamine--N-acetylmuramyl-(pentapeptide) pyrophosphoryl-undecaprenol N-acetylglucosamine transferase [Microcella frigidaquae]
MTTALLAGGGTAGHVNPLLALADHWRSVEPDARLLVLGTAEGLEARLVPARGYELLTVPRVPFPRRPDRAALSFPRRFRAAVARTRAIIREHGVEVVVGFGGYAAAPAYVAAHREGVPIVAHEANAKPGIANRLAVLLGGTAAATFSGTPLRGARVVGMPLRREITQLDRPALRPEARRELALDPDRPLLLVTGGSTGAQRLNETMTASAARLVGAGWQVLHLTGTGRGGDDPGLVGYRTMAYCDRMDLAFAAADLVLCRAGAATVSELAALGLPAVLVPYAAGNGEQRLNARELVAAGGAILLPDDQLTPDWVAASLVPLLERRDEIARMAAAAASVGHRDGAEALLAVVRESLAKRAA